MKALALTAAFLLAAGSLVLAAPAAACPPPPSGTGVTTCDGPANCPGPGTSGGPVCFMPPGVQTGFGDAIRGWRPTGEPDVSRDAFKDHVL